MLCFCAILYPRDYKQYMDIKSCFLTGFQEQHVASTISPLHLPSSTASKGRLRTENSDSWLPVSALSVALIDQSLICSYESG